VGDSRAYLFRGGRALGIYEQVILHTAEYSLLSRTSYCFVAMDLRVWLLIRRTPTLVDCAGAGGDFNWSKLARTTKSYRTRQRVVQP
jgi:hypothetical protein